jgi:type IV pilus assembly protein PilW
MKHPSLPMHSTRREPQLGVSLIELMVALVIGLFMIGGAIAVYLKAQDAYATTDATARLQENARYALGIIESDVRMANFWGLNNRPDFITANGSSAFPSDCGTTFATDVDNFLAGTNNTYSLSCGALGGGAVTGSDVLVVRHASATRITPQATPVAAAERDRVLVVSSRTAGQIFVPKDISNALPPGYATSDPVNAPPLADTRQMVANAYYVSQNSSVASGYPALRRKHLVAGPAIGDEEILPGVQNLQFQMGVDTNEDGTADAFVNPGSVPADARPVSVRVWLLLRAQDLDVSFSDSATYAFGDQTLPAPGDRYRRMLVSKTIQLRNARP